ncbi:hypothetical protein SDC9_111611 [bioreactor metagenome]|uniref:Uncharacterized protein n=1 Tax=bioreactor metagenome TaxID=1076179 RepID=A0A645BHH7_9ZZZZ
MVRFVSISKPLKNMHRIIDRRFINKNRLETAFKGRILFYIFSILFKSRCAYNLKFSSRQTRLKNISRIDSPFSSASSNYCVNLVNKDDNISSLSKFLQKLPHSLFEFASILCACNEIAHIQLNYFFPSQNFCDITIVYLLRESFNNSCFSYSWIAKENRIVLCASRKNLNNSLNFFITAYYWI